MARIPGFSFSQVKMGALFLNDAVQKSPKNPVWDGDIPLYDGKSSISIRDIPADTSEALITWNRVEGMEKWSETGTLLIADRVLLADVSWGDLAKAGFANGTEVILGGKIYICRLLPVGGACNSRNAWNKAVNVSTHKNSVWHWKDVYFWGADESGGIDRHAIRGNNTVCSWADGESDKRSPHIGFRPMLEPLNIESQKEVLPKNKRRKSKAVTTSDAEEILKDSETKTTSEKVPASVNSDSKKMNKKKSGTASVPEPTSSDSAPLNTTKMLCSAMNVQVNEAFCIGNQWYTIRTDGMLYKLSPSSRWSKVKDVDTIAEVVNNAAELSRVPTFTEEEKSMILTFEHCFGKNWAEGKVIERVADGALGISGNQNFWMELNRDLFPSILPGLSFPIQQVA